MSRLRPDGAVTGWLGAQNQEELFLSVVTLGEIRKGFTIQRDANRRAFLENWLQNDLLPWFAGRILPVTHSIANRWGVLDGEAYLRGTPLNMADGLIAATALEHQLTVVTRNAKDFARMGVSLFNPWESAKPRP